MSKLPQVTGRKLLAALGKAGFTVTRVRGSHHFVTHSDGRRTVVPVHGNERIGSGLLRKILRDADLSREDLVKLLR